MERVGIPRARDRARAYPHEFSGGMRQRAMIAMALSLSPSVLIADEPTTALDVTIQAQILRRDQGSCSQEIDSGVIFVTHDLGVVADIADRVIVMYAGRVVEQGTLDEIFYDPQHPYTWGLLGSVTRDGSRASPAAARDPRAAAVAAQRAEGLSLPARAVRTPSIAAARCRRSRRAYPMPPSTWIAAGSSLAEKREQARGRGAHRLVEPGVDGQRERASAVRRAEDVRSGPTGSRCSRSSTSSCTSRSSRAC